VVLFPLQKNTDVMSSALLVTGHVAVAWKLVLKECTSRNQGLRSHSEETKKGKVFGILS